MHGDKKITKKQTLALLTGAVEYTNCTSAEEYAPPTNVLDMTLNNLIVKFQ